MTIGTMLEVLRQGGRGYGKVKPLMLLQRIAHLQLLGEQRRAEHTAPQLQELLAAAAQLGDTEFLSFVRSVAQILVQRWDPARVGKPGMVLYRVLRALAETKRQR